MAEFQNEDGSPEARRQSPKPITALGNGADKTIANGAVINKMTAAEIAAHNRAVALTWAAAGMCVHPCYAAGPKVKEPRLKAWNKKATTDLATIGEWWDKWPDSLPAILVGEAGLFVVDPDRHGGPDGVAEWRKICAEHNWSDEAQPVVSTSGDGEHAYFKQPAEGAPIGNSKALDERGINVRGRGGYTIAPGAMLPDGRKWRMRQGSPDLLTSFKAGTIPVAPEWLVKMLRASRPEKAKRETPQPKGVVGPRERACAKKALEDNAAELAEAKEGGRNNKLNGIAYRMGRMIGAGWIERDEVEDALWEACVENGLKSFEEHDGGNPFEVKDTMRSGIEAGMAEPMDPLAPDGKRAAKRHFETLGREVFEQNGDLIDKATGEILTAGAAEEETKETADAVDDDAPDYADEILKLPGLVADIAEWVLDVAQVPQKRFAVATALTVISAAAARHLLTPTMSALNLYLLLLAKTTNGKDAPQAAVKNLLKAAGLREMIGPPGGNSDIGILMHCYRHPVTVMAIDEFGDILAANSAHNASSHAQKVGAVYKMMWSGGQLSVPAAASRGHIVLDDPFLALLCASTPAQFFNAVSGKQVADGMLNRFLGIFAPQGLAPFNEDEGDINDAPQGLAQRLRQLADRPGAPDPKRFRRRKKKTEDDDDDAEEEHVAPPPAGAYVVPWGAGAQDIYKAYRDEQRVKIDADSRRETLGPRCAHNAVKIATILAISEEPEQPVVHLRHMRLGIALAEASFHGMTRGFDTHAPDSKTADLQDKLLHLIRKSPNGKVGRVEMYRTVRRWFDDLRSFDTMVEVLLASGLILAFKETPKNGGKSKAWLQATDAAASSRKKEK